MKVLVIQKKMIGDVLTSTVICSALKHLASPAQEVHYLIDANSQAVVENHPDIDKFILTGDKAGGGFIAGASAKLALLRRIRAERYDIVIDAYGKIESCLFSLSSGAATRIAFDKWYTRIANQHTVKRKRLSDPGVELSISNRLLLLSPLGSRKNLPYDGQNNGEKQATDLTTEKPTIFLSTEEKEWAKDFLHTNGIHTDTPLIMIGVLGSGVKKTYPHAYMARVIDRIAAQRNVTFLFNYIPSQAALAQDIFNHCETSTQNKIKFSVYTKSLREFLAVMSQCDALIGNEGGAVNMAKALDKPTFSIFSPNIGKERWAVAGDTRHAAVHLRDKKPEIYEGMKEKQRKQEYDSLYQAFDPELFTDQLDSFLAEHIG